MAKNYYEGGGWIRREKSAAIRVIRDDFTCCYCFRTPQQHGIGLTLDHLYGKRGDPGYNNPENLVTACWACNNGRGTKPVHVWLDILSRRGGPDGEPVDIVMVLQVMHARTTTPVTKEMVQRGKELIADPPAWLSEMWEINKGFFKARKLAGGVEEPGWEPEDAPPLITAALTRPLTPIPPEDLEEMVWDDENPLF